MDSATEFYDLWQTFSLVMPPTYLSWKICTHIYLTTPLLTWENISWMNNMLFDYTCSFLFVFKYIFYQLHLCWNFIPPVLESIYICKAEGYQSVISLFSFETENRSQVRNSTPFSRLLNHSMTLCNTIYTSVLLMYSQYNILLYF